MSFLIIAHLSTIKECSGAYEVSVLINYKNKYRYLVTNELAIRIFNYMMSKMWYGKALNFLKRYELIEKEKFVEEVSAQKEHYDYSFSDVFRYKDRKIGIELPLSEINPTEALNKIKDSYNLFERVRETWNSKRN